MLRPEPEPEPEATLPPVAVHVMCFFPPLSPRAGSMPTWTTDAEKEPLPEDRRFRAVRDALIAMWCVRFLVCKFPSAPVL